MLYKWFAMIGINTIQTVEKVGLYIFKNLLTQNVMCSVAIGNKMALFQQYKYLIGGRSLIWLV